MLTKLFIPLLTVVSAITITNKNVWAQDANGQFVTNDNDIGNTGGVVNQTAIYSIGESASYGFNGLYCSRPSFLINASNNGNYFSLNSNNSNNYTVSGAFIMPLGGKVGKNCQEISTTIMKTEKFKLEEYKIKSAVETVKLCADMISSGITVDPKEYPLLAKKCSAVAISKDKSSNSQGNTLRQRN